MSQDDQNPRVAEADSAIDKQPGVTPGSSWTLDDLTEDLRRVAGMRTPKALRDAHLPSIAVCLDVPDDPDRRLEELRGVITAAISDVDDPQFRGAAEALFGFGNDRWTPLRRRGERASAWFNCSFDAYRRARRSTGVSLLDETVRQLARAIDARVRTEPAGVPGARPAPTEADAPTTAEPADRSADSRRRRRVFVGAFGLAVVAAAVVTATIWSDSDTGEVAAATTVAGDPKTSVASSVTSGSTTKCHAIGQTSDADLVDYRMAFRTQVDQLTPPGEPRPCGGAPMDRWEALVVQPLIDEHGAAAGAIVAIDPDHVLSMTQAEYQSYHQIGGKDGTQAQVIAGLPRRRATSTSGKVWLIITDHGAMASAGVDQPGFYLGDVVWSTWKANGEDTGEWGMPASNPLNNAVGYYQDFSKGRLTLSYSGTLTFQPVAAPAVTLPEGFKGQILRHDDGTTWYIDGRGVRHWIPDGDTWFCIHDRGAREIGHIPGYAITTLRLGAPATCAE